MADGQQTATSPQRAALDALRSQNVEGTLGKLTMALIERETENEVLRRALTQKTQEVQERVVQAEALGASVKSLIAENEALKNKYSHQMMVDDLNDKMKPTEFK